MISAAGSCVELIDVCRTYRTAAGDVSVLDGVSASFDAGTFTAVMGPSGSGKSTLLHCAAGLDQVTSGDVRLGGVSIVGMPDRQLTRLRQDTIGFVFQAFHLIPALTARQNAELPRRLAGRPAPAAEVDKALNAVGLAGLARHRPALLSGGEKQRVAIARALLMTRPGIVFADEPTGALDLAASRGVLNLLRRLVDESGITLVMVTRDPKVASRADRTLFLADGRIVAEAGRLRAATVAEHLVALQTAV
ncbi:MAG TPA: ABC transporter ATP-binding protein [Trebonia sp.]